MESTTLKNSTKGFTLIEMMICLAIIGILTVIMVLSQSNFNRTNILTDTTYTVAIAIREAQTLGVSSRAYSSVPDAGYGMHFGDSPLYFQQFADIYPAVGSPLMASTPYCPHILDGSPSEHPGDCVYDSGDGLIQTYTLSQGYSISNLCYLLQNTSAPVCFAPGTGNTMDIVYERPNTQARMSVTISGATTMITQATIELTSPQGGKRCAIATQLGEISVSSICP